jgi:dehydrogenase/reductase SDR family member 4
METGKTAPSAPAHPFDLSGKVAVITGSSRGIGRAIALDCAKMGAKVVVSSRKIDACQAVVDEIRAAGGEATAIACNVGRKDELEALAAHAMSEYGKIDILVPNAAINPWFGPSADIPDEIWNKVLASNLTATHWLCQMVLPGMAERGGGAVVVLSSIAAVYGNARLGIYGISKAAEAQLVRNLAVEWGPRNIRVNAIGPSVIRTDFAKALYEDPKAAETVINRTCLKRIGDPEDVSGVAVFLASEAARYITGQLLLVDGGTSIYLPSG